MDLQKNARILGAEFAVPDKVMHNEYFARSFGQESVDWLENTLGIKERRWCGDHEDVTNLCVKAAEKALDRCQLSPLDLDLIIVATDTPAFLSPATAAVVQNSIGAKGVPCFDINNACAGFVNALDMAARYVRTDSKFQRCLVIGAYAMSKFLNPKDRKTINIFADGAGAVVIGAHQEAERGFVNTLMQTNSEYYGWMGVYGGGSMLPGHKKTDNEAYYLQFRKKFPKDLNSNTWTEMISSLVVQEGIKMEDIKKIFFTQININSIWETLERLQLPRTITHTVVEKYGYTGSACIPMALADYLSQHDLQPGDPVLFMGSGGGVSFCCSLWRW